jgi:HK97 family phage major capsid protein
MTMTDNGLTAREVIEKAIADLDTAEQAIIEKGAAATDEDIKAADELGQKVARLFNTLPARDYLADQSRIVDGKSFDDLASATGIIDSQGMTFGEAFTKSPAYLEQLDINLKSDGSFIEHIGKTRSVDFAVAMKSLIEGKTLVTGASQTSGGSFLTNERIPYIADVVPYRRPRVIDLMTRIPLMGDTMEWVEVTARTNNAAPVAEATSAADGLKPESALTFAERTQAVQTIAHWIPITRRAAADAPQLRAYIDQFLLDGLVVKVEDQLVNGTGVSPQLRGILNATTVWNIQTYDISVALNPTRLDAVATAASLIMSGLEGQFEPTGLLVNPLDWFSINFLMAKDTTGQYLGVGPFASPQTLAQIWGIPVVVTKAVPVGTQLLGDFRQALVGDREQAALYMTDSHSDFFIRNILTILAELRLAFALLVPQAFVAIVP